MDDIGEVVKKTHKPPKMIPGRKCPKGIYCDLSGENLKDNYNFIWCPISRVQVQLTGRSITCKSCGHDNTDESKPCEKCGHTELQQQADMAIDDQFLELWISEKTYKKLRNRAIELRTTEAAEWSMKPE